MSYITPDLSPLPFGEPSPYVVEVEQRPQGLIASVPSLGISFDTPDEQSAYSLASIAIAKKLGISPYGVLVSLNRN